MVKPDLSVEIGAVRLKNPVLTASGTFGYGLEFAPFYDLSELGGVVVKGLSPKPRRGNPPERIVETPAGMLNAIGLQNVGVDRFLSEKLPALRAFDTAVVANVFGETESDYVEVCSKLDGVDHLAAVELNVSCPNVEEGGMLFGTDPKLLGPVVRASRRALKKTPLWVKLSPNVSDIRETARAAEAEGADAITLVNTFVGMVVDVEKRRPMLANGTGGLSGPAIRPMAVAMTWNVSRSVSIPVVGMGGIMNARDALEFLLVGATAVQVGTANFVTPGAAADVVRGLRDWMAKHEVSTVDELIGSMRTGAPTVARP
jgi:dihydroorotate dehydrogenase (NAD+) catalytic subunit